VKLNLESAKGGVWDALEMSQQRLPPEFADPVLEELNKICVYEAEARGRQIMNPDIGSPPEDDKNADTIVTAFLLADNVEDVFDANLASDNFANSWVPERIREYYLSSIHSYKVYCFKVIRYDKFFLFLRRRADFEVKF
jgi:hypothetical protein